MTDIVWRLRLVGPNQVLLAVPPFGTSYLPVGLLCHEAAHEIERLREAALAEREACAKVCNDLVLAHPGRADLTAEQCAAAIRARGQKQ